MLTNITEQRIVDVTKVINAKEFIALRDFIVSEGEMQWLSNRFGQIPIISYPNGFSGTIAASDLGLIPHTSDYIEGHVYLVVFCDTGITDEQLMRQISSYYSLLL